MELIQLRENIITGVLDLFKILRQDIHPCSFWNVDRNELRNSIDDENQINLVGICSKDQVVGFGRLKRGGKFQEHWAEISIAIHPNYRKKGCASNMALGLEEYKEKLNIEFIKAVILENNEPSRRFFESLGYQHKATLYNEFKIEGIGNVSDCVFYKFF